MITIDFEKPETWSAIADWIIAVANIVLFVLGFLTLRHDRHRIAKMEESARRRFAENVYVGIEERSAMSVTAFCRNGGNSAIYDVCVGLVGKKGIEIGPRYEMEIMKPLEERELRIENEHAIAVIGVAITFRDPAGIGWLRLHDGRLTEVTERRPTQDPV